MPLLIVILADLRNLATLDRGSTLHDGGRRSIYPFVWSLLLAAHDVGLGGVFTSVAIPQEDGLRTLFDLPEPVIVAGVLALGYPGKRAKKLRRNPVESFATFDRYDGPPVTSE